MQTSSTFSERNPEDFAFLHLKATLAVSFIVLSAYKNVNMIKNEK